MANHVHRRAVRLEDERIHYNQAAAQKVDVVVQADPDQRRHQREHLNDLDKHSSVSRHSQADTRDTVYARSSG